MKTNTKEPRGVSPEKSSLLSHFYRGKTLLWLLITLVIIAIGYYLITEIDLSVLRQLSTPTIACLVLLTALSVLMNTLVVKVLLDGMGYKLPLKSVYLVVSGGGTASFATNIKLGIPARVFLYRVILGIPVSVGTASVVLETTVLLFTVALIMAIPMPGIWRGGAWMSSLSALSLVAVAVVVFMYWPKLEAMIPQRLFRFRTQKVLDFIAHFRRGIRKIKPADLIKMMCIFTSNYVIQALALYLSLKEWGWQLNILALAYTIVFSILAGVFSPLPMGLGTQDVSLFLLLTRLGPSQDAAVAAALILRILRTIVPLILGLISLNILGLDRIRNRDDVIVGESDGQGCAQQPSAVGETNVYGKQ